MNRLLTHVSTHTATSHASPTTSSVESSPRAGPSHAAHHVDVDKRRRPRRRVILVSCSKCQLRSIALITLCLLLGLPLFKTRRTPQDTYIYKSNYVPPSSHQLRGYARHRGLSVRSLKAERRSDDWRENLLPDVGYITGGIWNGASNQLHSALNLIHLGLITQRVPILPVMMPVHIEPPNPSRYSDWWDLDSFRERTGIPVIEMNDLRVNETVNEDLQWDAIGCWSTQEATLGGQSYSAALEWHHIDFDVWPLPPELDARDAAHAGEMFFTELKAFDKAVNRQRQWLDQLDAGSPTVGALLDSLGREAPPWGAIAPTAHVFCVDNLFKIKAPLRTSTALDSLRDEERTSWETVGQHLRWSKALDAAAEAVLADVLGSAHEEFLAIHIRRGDLGTTPTKDYDAPLKQIRTMLSDPAHGTGIRPDAHTLPVIVVSDDAGRVIRKDCAARGWHLIDHDEMKTAERFGSPWYPSMIDANILSRAMGIVGTSGSTFSFQAMLRVEAWQKGAAVWA